MLRSIQLERRGWTEIFPLGRHSVYVFTETPEETGNHFAARMFSPGMGLGEDPGTGSAAAALIGLIAGNAPFAAGQAGICRSARATRWAARAASPCRCARKRVR